MATPDRFYLGHLPDETGRFYAHLDALATVQNNTEKLKPIRIAKLSNEFRSDLNLRFFLAFSKQGFDDHSWYSTEDLDWLVKAGQAELQQLDTKLAKAKADGDDNPKAIEGRQRKIEKLKQELRPFERELETRND